MPANGPHIIPLVYDKVQYFPDSNRIYQYLLRVNRVDATTKLLTQKAFNLIGVGTSAQMLGWVEDMLQQIAYNQQPKIFNVNQGEDFALEIDLEEGRDFSGYLLTARLASDGTLLSPNNTAGLPYSTNPVQQITISDLSLAPGFLYQINALLEHPDGFGLAGGDAATLLTKAYLIVENDIDA